jgi:hypothetical protein
MATEARWTPIVQAPLGPIEDLDVRVELHYETPDWEAIYEIRAVNGRPAIASIRVKPRTEGTPPELPATLARELMRPGEAVQRAQAYMTDPLTTASASVIPMMRALLDRYHDPTPRQGKRQPDRFYAGIAALYVEAVAAGSRRPVQDTARALGPDYQPPFVRDALTRARRRGLLTRPKTPAKAGGELTALGCEALEDRPSEQ